MGILIVIGVWSYKRTIQEATRKAIGYNQVQQALQEQKEAMKELQRQNKIVIHLNEKYRKEIREIRNDLGEVSHDIEKIQEQNKKVAKWANNTVPVPVLNRLREQDKDSNKNRNREGAAPKEMSNANRTSNSDRK